MPAFDRSEALRRLANDPFDVVVVGGGITGAGVALDAASRGLSTALVEQDDFASGTSSRSSKFVHGGLRYLRQRQFRLVGESLLEQRRLLRNAPHLVRPLPVLLPVKGGVRKAGSAAVLAVHDLIGGGGRSRITASGVIFHEAQVDDARLTLAVLRTAVLDHGAVAANRCPVVRFGPGGVELAGGTWVRARAVVNATGVWSDHLAGAGGPAIRPAKGVHLVVPRARVPFETAVVLRLPGENRWAFVTPWEDRAMIGTTDTDYDGPLDRPEATEEDVAALLGAVNGFVADPLGPRDVLSAWAGLRPLVAGGGGGQASADLSRRHRVVRSPDGVVTVVGGSSRPTAGWRLMPSMRPPSPARRAAPPTSGATTPAPTIAPHYRVSGPGTAPRGAM